MYMSGPLTGVLHYKPEDDPRLEDVVYEEEGFRRICEVRLAPSACSSVFT